MIYGNPSTKILRFFHIERGEFILVLDSTCRENEGDLIIAAEDITPSKMAFLIHHSSGLICAPVSSSVTLALGLSQMVPKSEATETEGTAYTISVDAAKTTTGISAADRALTCKALSDPMSRGDGFRRPGHVFPLQARDGGVRERRGHTEASVEFCRLAGKREVGVLCEVVEEGREIEGKSEREGTGMMRRDGCLRFGRRWGIKVCTIEMLVDFLEQLSIKG